MEIGTLYNPKWATTSTGKLIEMHQSVQNPANFSVLFIGGVHGDEPEGVVLAQAFLTWLLAAPHQAAECCNWSLIPCLNPDGYAANQRTNVNGVDLNRNFPAKDWQPAAVKDRYYSGPHPASELETAALIHWLEQNPQDLIVHFHSWQPSIVYTGEPAAKLAEILAHHSGYKSQPDIGYPTPGSLGQWGWHHHQAPVLCIEAQEKSDLSTVWPRFASGLAAMMTTKSWQWPSKIITRVARS